MPNDAPATTTAAPAITTTAAPATTTTAAPAAFDWSAHVADESVRGWVTAKGYKDPGALAQSALNQEKLLGVPADQIVRLPTKPDDMDGWNKAYDQMGRPKEAKDYGLPLPEGDKGEFATTASGWFHEAGLSRKQAVAVTEKWNAHVAQQTKAQKDADATRDVEQIGALKTAWGPTFDANVALVDKTAASFGMSAEQLTALKGSMGPGAAMKFLHAIGSKMGVEGQFVVGGDKGNGAAMTPEHAQAQIQALKDDGAFVKRFNEGDSDARAKMKALHQQAYPGDTVL